MRTVPPLIALLGAAALTLTACTGTGAGAGAGGDKIPVDGATFTMAIGTDPGTLNPMLTSVGIARNIDRFLYTRLVEVRSDGKIVSGLATAWTSDLTTATFTVNREATCQDGTPFTASQVAANISFLGDPANGSPLTGTDVQPGTTATGDDATGVVTVTSGMPDPFLLESVGSISLVCGSALEDPAVLAKGGGATGMYTMKDIAANAKYTLTLRKDFTWVPGDADPKLVGAPSTVVFSVLPNETTAANLLLAGQVNAAQILGPDAERLRASGLFQASVETATGQVYFNQAAGRIGKSEALRIALTHGLDLTELRTVTTGGTGVAPTGLVGQLPNPCRIDSVKGNVPDFDVKAANAGLDAEGWKTGSDGIREKEGKRLSLTVIYPNFVGDSFAASAELLQSMWKKVGVEAVVRGVDANGMNDALFTSGNWDVSMVPFGVGMPSQLVAYFSGPTPPAGANFASFDNAEYSAGVARASAEAGKAGCADWAAAEVPLITSASVVPFANSLMTTFGNKATFDYTESLVPSSIRMFE